MMKITTKTATVLVLTAPSVLVLLPGMSEILQSARVLPRLQALCLEAAIPVRTNPYTYTHTCTHRVLSQDYIHGTYRLSTSL